MQLQPVTLDLQGMRDCLARRGTPARVFFFEHSEADRVKADVFERFNLRATLPASENADSALRREIAVQRFLGHEIFRVRLDNGRITRALRVGSGPWENEHTGVIRSWADFEAAAWPDPSAVDYGPIEWYEKHLPDDMGIYVTTHVWEDIRAVFGFETFCYKLYEEPELVDAVARRVGEFNIALTRALCDFRCVFAVYGSDDFGYKSGLMMPPDVLSEKVLVWHKRMSEHTHAHDKLYLLHACGNLAEIMDELIDDVGIDAKHSFEDVIMPVTEAKRQFGDRIALLGGLDVDIVARSDEATIRAKVREILDVCHPGGGYCLGLGNWVTDYIPLDSYLAVLDEGRNYGRG